MEIQFTLPINTATSSGAARRSAPSSTEEPAPKGRGGIHRFALDTRTRHTRRSSTRARTGCTTSCLNCMKWRGYCDSYTDSSSSQPQSHSSSSNSKLIHSKKAPLLIIEPSVNTIRFANNDQRDYFTEWSNLSVTFLGGLLDQTRLWTATMPQVTLEENTLRYGAMAVGALRKAYQVQGSELGLDNTNRHYLNAIVYYCEALRMQSEMKPTREGLRTALLSSLLFICFESQRGNVPAALKHITHGFTMLNELANCTDKAPDLVSIAPAPPALVQDILDCYKPLELQSRSFMGSYRKFFFPPQPPQQGGQPSSTPSPPALSSSAPPSTIPPQKPQHPYSERVQQINAGSPIHSAPRSPSSQPETPPSTFHQSPQAQPTGLPSPQSQASPKSQGDSPSPQPFVPRRPPGIIPFTKHSPYFRPKLTNIVSLDDMPRLFKSWDEMRDYWGLVQRQMVRHVPMLTRLTSEMALHKTTDVAEVERKLGSLKTNPTLSKFIAESRYWLQRWTEAYQPMYETVIRNAEKDRALYLQALSIRIEYLILYIYTTVPRYSSLITVKGLTPQYREINALAEELLRSRPNCGFAMDAGWTWPLFVVSFGCRDRAVREEAIRILGQYPIRNALRDSRIFRAIGIKNNETEIMNTMEGDENEQWMRLRRRELVFEDFGSSIIFRFVQKDPVTGQWGLVEEVTDFSVGSDGRLPWRRQPISESESILSGVC
ncbi:c6 zinc finger domain [Trichoderma arundinaceum]|uniref:C6 zinc finger domain n=1 Tax=Trichoderma arundinaceum TaxID=490622 RepID=A0A395NYD7_TRIAR|nr:c6 zinc finger domain [Trichoderma arundinaceum]